MAKSLGTVKTFLYLKCMSIPVKTSHCSAIIEKFMVINYHHIADEPLLRNVSLNLPVES